MSVFAAVTTDKGTGAISTIELLGEKADEVLRRIFRPTPPAAMDFRPGGSLLGHIVEGDQQIDQVVVGFEGPGHIAIHCHGNPLIVEQIMELLGRQRVVPLESRRFLCRALSANGTRGAIAVEAAITLASTRAPAGTRIIASQVQAGLGKLARDWLENLTPESVAAIKARAKQVLGDSRTARPIIFGFRAVIAGPPNSGKSTLFNRLCGRTRAIVSHVKGTTRDWLSAWCRFGSLAVELIDTAGLDHQPAAGSGGDIDRQSQRRAFELLEQADLVLLVLDGSIPTAVLDDRVPAVVSRKKVIVVANKCDLGRRLETQNLPGPFAHPLWISAEHGTGIEDLVERFQQCSGLADFDVTTAVCFTARQRHLLRRLLQVGDHAEAAVILKQLLNGPVDGDCLPGRDDL